MAESYSYLIICCLLTLSYSCNRSMTLKFDSLRISVVVAYHRSIMKSFSRSEILSFMLIKSVGVRWTCRFYGRSIGLRVHVEIVYELFTMDLRHAQFD